MAATGPVGGPTGFTIGMPPGHATSTMTFPGVFHGTPGAPGVNTNQKPPLNGPVENVASLGNSQTADAALEAVVQEIRDLPQMQNARVGDDRLLVIGQPLAISIDLKYLEQCSATHSPEDATEGPSTDAVYQPVFHGWGYIVAVMEQDDGQERGIEAMQFRLARESNARG